MSAILEAINEAIASATAPRYHDTECPVMGGYCPHCGSDLLIKSYPQNEGERDTWAASRWYYGACTGENHDSLPLKRAKRLPCYHDETVTDNFASMSDALEACVFEHWKTIDKRECA